MVRLTDLFAVWCDARQESVAVTEMEEVPLPVGVPVSAPDVASESPAGTPEAVQVIGSMPPAEAN